MVAGREPSRLTGILSFRRADTRRRAPGKVRSRGRVHPSSGDARPCQASSLALLVHSYTRLMLVTLCPQASKTFRPRSISVSVSNMARAFLRPELDVCLTAHTYRLTMRCSQPTNETGQINDANLQITEPALDEFFTNYLLHNQQRQRVLPSQLFCARSAHEFFDDFVAREKADPYLPAPVFHQP